MSKGNRMDEQGYNGWTNYETWAVALWMDNEEGSYLAAREQAREVFADAEGGEYGQTREEEARYNLAEMLTDEYAEANPFNISGEASVFSDLLNAALSEVNWSEIAGHLIDEVAEEVDA